MSHRDRIAALGVAVLLCACSQPTPPSSEERVQRLEQAGEPVDAHRMAARITAMRAAAIMGDQTAVQTQMDAMNEEFRRAVKIPDASRPIDHEEARAVVRALDGVRGVGWVDRGNLLVMVDDASLRSQAMIDTVCLGLQPLGDTLAVVVHLQNAAARNHDELQTLSRNCQLQGDDQAFMQSPRPMDVLPENDRRQHAAARSSSNRKPDQAAIQAALDETPEM